jgi:hypothetical protein
MSVTYKGITNMTTTTHTVRTKLDARATSKTESAVVIDWSTISMDDLRKLAAKTVIIAAQTEWRASGDVPSSVTLDANTYANPSRKPRGPVDIKALLAKMSPEERAAALAEYL